MARQTADCTETCGNSTIYNQEPGIRRPVPFGKRALDVVLSGIGLMISSPLWLALAAAIKLEDGGPVFFTQDRVGEGGRVFHGLKFRSMILDAEAAVGALQATEARPAHHAHRPHHARDARWTNCRSSGTSSAAT